MPRMAQTARPNVVVILVDDMGFSDIGPYGSEIPTPNLDKLAAGGLRFTQFYNAARCSPSRAALLTGTYPHQAGVGHLEPIVVPASKGIHGHLEDRVVTMAEVMRGAGYYTAMAGKWHVGISYGVGPWNRGFTRSIASPRGEIYYRDQAEDNAKFLYVDGKKVPASSDEIGKDYWYSSDLFVDWGTRFIKEAQEQKKPFFLYLPFVGVHFPLMAPAADVARFRGHYMQGWDALREARFRRQQQSGLLGKEVALPPRLANSYDWAKLTPAQRDRFDGIMATYAADVYRMDKAVGELVSRLRAMGQLDNTLILFMADNGGNGESGPDGRSEGGPLGSATSSIFAGMNWATLQNTPFQYFKHYTEEGGISTPLIAYWPNGIDPHLNGTFVREPGHLVDIMATVADVGKAKYPAIYKGHRIIPMQGRSILPTFHGKSFAKGRALFWEHEGNRAVREGPWKLVARFRRPWELYDMVTDRTEMHDLASVNPDRVRHMAADWDKWAERSDVDTWQESFDFRLKGIRQNWGDATRPKLPGAMDAKTPDLERALAQ